MPYKTYTDAEGEKKSSFYPGQWQERTQEQIDQSTGQSAQPQSSGVEVPVSDQSYWEDPQKIVSYKKMLDIGKSNPGWQPPAGLDTAKLDQAYSYFQFKYKDLPETQWKPLTADDPVREFLKSIPTPPVELMSESERNQYEQQVNLANEAAQVKAEPLKEVGDWNKLEWDRQIVSGFFSANDDPNLQNRPEWTRAPATLVQGVMGGIAPAMLIGAVTGGTGAIPAFLAFGGLAAYQAYTGQRIPVLSDIYDKFQIPAKALEAGIGQLSLDMTPEERVKAILENPVNMIGQVFGAEETAAMAAGRMKYETSKPVVMDTMIWALDTAYNLGSDTAGLFGAGWAKQQIDQAGTGYRWDIHKGINDPVKIQGSIQDKALQEYYDKLKSVSPENFNKAVQEIEQDAYDRFGYSGVLNDLVGQTILDPLNFAPFVEGIGAEKMARLMSRVGVQSETMSRFAGTAGRMKGNPMIDVLPFGVQNIVEAITRGKGAPDWKPFGKDIGVFGRREASKGLLGTVMQYKSEVQQGLFFDGTIPREVTPLERRIAGIDVNNRIKDFNAVEQKKGRLANAIQYISTPTAESKGTNYLTRLEDFFNILSDGMNDVHEIDAHAHKLAEASNPAAVQKVFDEASATVAEKRQYYLENSPMASTVAEGLRYAVDVLDKSHYLDNLDASTKNRDFLINLAKVTEDTPANILEKIAKNPDAYFDGIKLKPEVANVLNAGGFTTAEALKTHFDIFIGTGKDKVAWHPDEMKATYNIKLLDAVGDYLVKKYDIKPSGSTMRLVGVMKQVQSLFVLGINPGYFMNNMINNVVSRAAQGVFGLMTPTQTHQALTRLGMDKISRLDVGVGAGGEGAEAGGLSAVHRATMAKDVLDDARKTIRAVSGKIGLFQNLSQKIEQAESRQAYTIGILSMWNKVWKVDVGFDRFTPEVEKALDAVKPGLKEAYYEAVGSGGTMEEIRNKLANEFIRPEVRSVFDDAINRIMNAAGDEQKQAVRDLITESGIEDFLRDKLEKAKTNDEVNNAVSEANKKLVDHIRTKKLDYLETTAQEIPALLKTEGTVAVFKVISDVYRKFTKTYLDHFKDWGELEAKWEGQDFDLHTLAVKDLMEQQAKAFKDLHDEEIASYNGIIEGLRKGGSQSIAVDTLVNKIAKLNVLSEEFFKFRNDEHIKLYQSGLRGEAWDAARAVYDNLIKSKVDEYNAARKKINTEITTSLGGVITDFGGDAGLRDMVIKWHNKTISDAGVLEEAMQSLFDQFRKGGVVGLERDKAWFDFHENVYTPKVQEMLDNTLKGANEIIASHKVVNNNPLMQEDDAHWWASTPENSTGWDINNVNVPAYTPETLLNAVNLMASRGLQFSKTMLDLESVDVRKQMLDEIQKINPKLHDEIKAEYNKPLAEEITPEEVVIKQRQSEDVAAEALANQRAIAKQHAENIANAKNILDNKPETSPIARKVEVRTIAMNEAGITNDPQIVRTVAKYTKYKDLKIGDITPEILREALATRLKKANPAIFAPDDYYKNRFSKVSKQVKPLIIEQARRLLAELEAGRNGERINTKNPTTNAMWYRNLYAETKAARRDVIRDLSAIIVDPESAKGKHVPFLLGLVDDTLVGNTMDSIHSTYDPYFQWLMGSKDDVAAYYNQYLQGLSDQETASWFGNDAKIASDVVDYWYKWLGENPEPEQLFIDGKIDPYILSKLAKATPETLDNMRNVAKSKQENIEASRFRYEYFPTGIDNKYDAIVYFDNQPVALAFPEQRIGVDASGNEPYQVIGHKIDDPEQLAVYFPNDDEIVYQSVFKEPVAEPKVKINEDTFYTQLQKVTNLTNDQMEAMSIIHKATVRLMAEDLGIKPEDIYANFSEITAGQSLNGLDQSIDTPEFRNWFGDSKVVDETGNPLVVYHGTGADFQEFSPFKVGTRVDSGFHGKGYYFSTSPRIASDYADIYSQTPLVMPVYLSAKKLYRWGEKSNTVMALANGVLDAFPQDLLDGVLKRSGFTIDDLKEYKQSEFSLMVQKEIAKATTEELKQRGYDGVVININGKPSEYLVFDPEQIKSVNNRGTFDPADPNILHQTLKGSAEQGPDGRWRVKGTSYADISTALHEPTHVFLTIAPLRDQQTVTNWLRTTYKMNLPDDWMLQDYKTNVVFRDAHEKFARAREKYHLDGIAPEGASPQLIKVFDRIKQWMSEIYKQVKGSAIDIEITPELRKMLDEWALGKRIGNEPIGETSFGKTPTVLNEYEMLNEIYSEKLKPMLNQFSDIYKERMKRKMPGITKMSPENAARIEEWMINLQTQMTSAKLAAQRYGELQRDGALLNYTWRYGADNIFGMYAPYQFWYTRTMMEWGKRMIDRPAWFAMYARLKEAQRKTETKGIPARFAGQIRSYAPWLPAWAGSNLFSDPMQQLFPLQLYTDLGEGMQYAISSIDRETQNNIRSMVDQGKLSQEQADAALANPDDPIYITAYEEARRKSEMYNPVSLASLLMQPGAWITMPMNIANGTPEKISILPITKSSRAVGTALKGTPLEFLGNLVETMGAGPEVAIRKNAGISAYGRWGDYYIDRELANLVADGEYSPTDAMIAMIDRKGDAYKAAEDRVRTEEMYKTPLATGLQSIAQAISKTGKASAIAPALLRSTLPFGILPIGEMKQRGLAGEYSKAWDMMKAGDMKAVNKFFADHPEYQVRLAMNKEPEDRMRNLLIDQIWDRYNMIPSPDKRLVAEGLGEKFQTNFLNTETHDYATIDIPTLAFWAQSLGGQLPEKAGKIPAYQLPVLQTYSPALSKAIGEYNSEKNKLFPMVNIEQQLYFDNNQNKEILDRFPNIKKYWDWKKKYEGEHPVLKPYFEQNREEAKAAPKVEKQSFDPGNYALTPDEIKKFNPTLIKLIAAESLANQPLGEGAVASLKIIWESLGKPDGTLQKWYENKVKPTFGK